MASKDQKLEALRLRVEELQLNESKAGQRHDDVRARLDQLIAQERDSQRTLAALQDSKRKLQERLDEQQADSSAQVCSLSALLNDTQAQVVELERALKETGARYDAEASRATALQQRIGVLETELSQATEARARAELAGRSGTAELQQQLAAEVNRLTGLRDETLREGEKRAAALASQVEDLRRALQTASERALETQAALEQKGAHLASELSVARELGLEREAAAAAAEVRRAQAEAAAAAATRRAEVADAEARREREALAGALAEVDMCRSMVAEAELAAESAQRALETAKRDAAGDLQRELDSTRAALEEGTTRAQDAEQRATVAVRGLEHAEAAWARERELLRSVVSNTDSRLVERERDAEGRLFDANRALFEARNKLADLEPKYSDVVARLEAADARLVAAQSERQRRELNLQIAIGELEDQLAEAKEEAGQALERVRAELELAAQVERERARVAEADAAEARRLLQAEVSEVSMVESQARAELSALERRCETLRSEVAQQQLQVEAASLCDVRRQQELDGLRAELMGAQVALLTGQRELNERNAALETAEAELERLAGVVAAAESDHYVQQSNARSELEQLREQLAQGRLQAQERVQSDAQAVRDMEGRVREAETGAAVCQTRLLEAERATARLQVQLGEWQDKHRDVEARLLSANDELKTKERALRAAEDAAARDAKQAAADLARASDAADRAQAVVAQLEQALLVARGDLGTAQERIGVYERDAKERSEGAKACEGGRECVCVVVVAILC